MFLRRKTEGTRHEAEVMLVTLRSPNEMWDARIERREFRFISIHPNIHARLRSGAKRNENLSRRREG
jgi:hypothetical protein